MTDIVERLRDNAPRGYGMVEGDLMREAADVIERLKAARHADSQRMVRMSDEYEAAQDEIERLRAEIERLREHISHLEAHRDSLMAIVARQAEQKLANEH